MTERVKLRQGENGGSFLIEKLGERLNNKTYVNYRTQTKTNGKDITSPEVYENTKATE